MNPRLTALLLIGPTGSGKTPLGQILVDRGLKGRRCVHFDFGENLRRVVATGQADGILAVEDLAFLRKVLETGALLEDKDFPIAERILQRFFAVQQVDSQTLVVLNGLPRHEGQAMAIGEMLDVQTVVLLRCSPETVLARIREDTGGDRSNRGDDDLEAVRNKLAIFRQRTAPLADHYREQGASFVEVEVAAGMTAEQMWRVVDSHTRLNRRRFLDRP